VTVFAALAGSAAAFAQPAQALTPSESKCAALAPAGITPRFFTLGVGVTSGLFLKPPGNTSPSILSGSTVRTGILTDATTQLNVIAPLSFLPIPAGGNLFFTAPAGLSGFEAISYADNLTGAVVGVDCFIIGETTSINGSFTVTPQPGPCITLPNYADVSFGSVTAGATTSTPGSVATSVVNCAPFAETLVASAPGFTPNGSTIHYTPSSGSLTATQFEWGLSVFSVSGNSRVAISTVAAQIGSVGPAGTMTISHDFRVGAGWVDTSVLSYVYLYLTAVA
jgi:hypothetical protein